MNKPPTALAIAIRSLRLKRGWRQKDLAVLCDVEVAHISQLENGKILDPKISLVKKLANALDADLGYLIQKAPKVSSRRTVAKQRKRLQKATAERPNERL